MIMHTITITISIVHVQFDIEYSKLPCITGIPTCMNFQDDCLPNEKENFLSAG